MTAVARAENASLIVKIEATMGLKRIKKASEHLTFRLRPLLGIAIKVHFIRIYPCILGGAIGIQLGDK